MILGAMMLGGLAAAGAARQARGRCCRLILVFAVFTVAEVRLVLQAQRRTARTGREALVAERGEALSELAPEGWVRVQGERWRARAAERLASGDPIVVESVDGLVLRVRKGA
jgi:membrane-bound serine protease (ClpP class)